MLWNVKCFIVYKILQCQKLSKYSNSQLNLDSACCWKWEAHKRHKRRHTHIRTGPYTHTGFAVIGMHGDKMTVKQKNSNSKHKICGQKESIFPQKGNKNLLLIISVIETHMNMNSGQLWKSTNWKCTDGYNPRFNVFFFIKPTTLFYECGIFCFSIQDARMP